MPVSFSSTGPALDAARLDELAGPGLPAEYWNFMLANNGGALRESAHLPDDSSGTSVRAFLTVDDPQGPAGYDLAHYLKSYAGRYPQGFLPIGVDGSGNLILLDTGYEQPGSVWFWDHEAEADEDEPPRKDNITKIAESFAQFIATLTTELTDAQEEYIRQAAAEATFTPGTYKQDEPFSFD